MKNQEKLLDLLEEKQELLLNSQDVTNINQKIWELGIDDKLIHALMKYWDTNYQYEDLRDAILYSGHFLEQLFTNQPLLLKPKSLKEKYNIEDWDKISKEAKVILEDALKQIEERRNTISENKNCMARGESLKQIEQEIQDAIQAAYNYQPIESKISEPEQIPDFVKERRAKKNGQSIQISGNTNEYNPEPEISVNPIEHRLSILENRIDYLIQLVKKIEVSVNNSLERSDDVEISGNSITKDKKAEIYGDFSDYIPIEDRDKVKNISPQNKTLRDMYCPKCGEFIGRGSRFAHKRIIDSHTCKE